MKAVLISIKPEWCELIANGRKTVEVRKTRPKLETPFKVYIYCTKDKHGWFDFFRKTRLDGKIIGEFVCDRIQKYECEFVDDDCYEEIASVFIDEDGEEYGFVEWANDSKLSYESTELYEENCVKYGKLKKYIGLGFNKFYGWHISDLVIYDRPKELSEFRQCHKCEYWFGCKDGEYSCDGTYILKRPPQSWCYVEELKGE